MESLTKMQRRVLDAVNGLYKLKGELPTAGAVARRLRRAPSTITEHLTILETKGYVKRRRSGPWTRIVPLGVDTCPWCGKPR